MKVIGIIGGISSGKSTVAKAMKKLGAGYINADEIGHDVIGIPEIKQQMQIRWEGDSGYGHITNPDGKIRRDIIANIVFNDSEELKFLNDICHPIIKTRIQQSLRYFHPDYTKAVILDVPLLLEANWNRLCDVIVFVEASDNQRGLRAQKREECPLDLVELKKRESSQFNIEMKRSFADHVIDNDGSEAVMLQQVQSFWDEVINV
jgi:dephospho-CoA kinase